MISNMIPKKIKKKIDKKPYTATRNACKMCTPLGATMVFHGIEGTIPLLHGSQGCSTYMRRYLISHFREPVDIASSNFTEDTAIFGGGANLMLAIENVARQYTPKMIGIATTCLSETIGDDVPMILNGMDKALDDTILVHVSTPSYTGTHVDGFHGAVHAVVERCNPLGCKPEQAVKPRQNINVFPGMLSNEDIRHLKEIFTDLDIEFTILPDYSERLEGPSWDDYQVIQKGGTPIRQIQEMNRATASVEFGAILAASVDQGTESAGSLLKERFDIPLVSLGFPVGVKATDLFFERLEALTLKPMPERYKEQRGRLIDAYVDGNKYVSGQRAVVYGEEDFVVAIAGFLAEVGIIPVLCASGGKSGLLEKALEKTLTPKIFKQVTVHQGMDFTRMEQAAGALDPDFMIGNSKGYTMSRHLKVPLVRVGFPIHDRIGGQRILHIGYKGAQALFDAIVNTLLHHNQTTSKIGYAYM
ncbi:NifK2 [Desulforapulum autotrophicum HRM2]|uniref:NifK2 n=1 Tax=Desulforapulum autotrophicum (strain ATCC 43914 / DSM 3382 / VKM B-1955 / HRM2) TaxID=177437 RepID=C0QKL4_DESAH|nr:nitrogenase component 1 [Desulforapulum autotrophicum]ACN14085.1 NifK2 [Desulforapulum autotrophicum HRM2]